MGQGETTGWMSLLPLGGYEGQKVNATAAVNTPKQAWCSGLGPEGLAAEPWLPPAALHTEAVWETTSCAAFTFAAWKFL